MMTGLTLFQKKMFSIGFLLVVSFVLLTNAFITMWIITSIGLNSVIYNKFTEIKFACKLLKYQKDTKSRKSFPISFQDLALNLRGSHVEAKANIFALEALVANHIRSHINKGLFIQSSKNISLSAINAFQKSSLVLGNQSNLFRNEEMSIFNEEISVFNTLIMSLILCQMKRVQQFLPKDLTSKMKISDKLFLLRRKRPQLAQRNWKY